MSKRPDFHPLSLKQLAEKYGKKPRKRPVQRERAECFAFWEWYCKAQHHFRIPTLIFHVANQGAYAGTSRQRVAFAENLKRMGKVSGTPDYVVMPQGRQGFLIEFKAESGKESVLQSSFKQWAGAKGLEVKLAYSWHEAVELLRHEGLV
jgi:hypothetical protein